LKDIKIGFRELLSYFKYLKLGLRNLRDYEILGILGITGASGITEISGRILGTSDRISGNLYTGFQR